MMLSQMAVEQLKTYIVKHGLKPGDRLPTERELAEKLNVSRSVVREALNHLETLGLIVKRQGKGIFIEKQNLSVFFRHIVSMWDADPKTGTQLLEFRTMLETAALDLVVEQAGKDDYGRLETIIARSEQPDIDILEFIRLDFEFHRHLLELTKNDLFVQLVGVIHDYFNNLQVELCRNGGAVINHGLTIRDHRTMIELLRTKDVQAAKQLLRVHLLGG
jgi:GntR family transcriptional repressor for pyruvate dehydrogenase complex